MATNDLAPADGAFESVFAAAANDPQKLLSRVNPHARRRADAPAARPAVEQKSPAEKKAAAQASMTTMSDAQLEKFGSLILDEQMKRGTVGNDPPAWDSDDEFAGTPEWIGSFDDQDAE